MIVGPYARLVGTTALATLSATAFLPAGAQAQEQRPGRVADGQIAAEPTSDASDEILITGSRIRRESTDTSAPVTSVDSSELVARGYVQVGESLNTLPSIRPSFAQAAGSGSPSGDGQQFPDIFGLGAGRTLTLLNGRRMVTTSSGLGDRVVDTNTIPTGLLKRIDVVQAGGAAVYGSDAIAGVVNYVLDDAFDGVQLDVQSGITSRGDYPRLNAELVAGTNFAEGRGNIAIDLGYRKTDPLLFGTRPITDPVFRLVSNPLNTGPADGIPSRAPVYDPRFWVANEAGVIFTTPAPSARFILGQFNPDGGSIRPFDQGRPPVAGFNCPVPFCSGGDGYPYANLQALYSGVETFSANAVGHYDITAGMKISTELGYTRRRAVDPIGSQAPELSVLSGTAVQFTRDNPYLTPSAIAALGGISPGFAAGGPLYLSKFDDDLLPTRAFRYSTDIYRGLLALTGNFGALGRRFDYAVSFSHAEVSGKNSGYAAYTTRYANATDVARNASGQIVCAINAVTVVDAACVPINPFGTGKVTDAARSYATAPTGATYHNTQDDLLVTFGGDIISLPAGAAKFSLTYEHRRESAQFTPFVGDQNGYFFDSFSPPTSGRFNTDEVAAELLLPLVSPDMDIPLIHRLEVEGQYRSVDHSVAGHQNVWGGGVRWEPGYGLTLRGNRSRNFRAPTLDQSFAPQSTSLQGGIGDPCDTRFLNSGVAVQNRIANCRALFAANPAWGPLATFTDPAVNFSTALVTSGGNSSLSNEISDTLTYGFVWQPRFVPGNLSVSADRIEIDLKNGLTAFTPTDFANACFDASPQPAAACSTIVRDPATGYIVSARSTTFNAALLQYRGLVAAAAYRFPMRWIVGGADAGSLRLAIDATKNDRLRTTVAGVTTERAGTIVAPSWILRGTAAYQIGRVNLTYEVYRLPKTRVNTFDTIENTPFPTIAGNTRHSASVNFSVDNVDFRAGVNNLTDRGPSRATVINYGDVIGRQFFVRARMHFR